LQDFSLATSETQGRWS